MLFRQTVSKSCLVATKSIPWGYFKSRGVKLKHTGNGLPKVPNQPMHLKIVEFAKVIGSKFSIFIFVHWGSRCPKSIRPYAGYAIIDPKYLYTAYTLSRRLLFMQEQENLFVKKEKNGHNLWGFPKKMDQFLFLHRCSLNGKPVCVVCSQHVSVFKEYNIQRHYQTHFLFHHDQNTKLRHIVEIALIFLQTS